MYLFIYYYYFHVLAFDFKELHLLHVVHLVLEPKSPHCFALQTRISKVLTQASAVNQDVETNGL